jgi:hypothetical protein
VHPNAATVPNAQEGGQTSEAHTELRRVVNSEALTVELILDADKVQRLDGRHDRRAIRRSGAEHGRGRVRAEVAVHIIERLALMQRCGALPAAADAAAAAAPFLAADGFVLRGGSS